MTDRNLPIATWYSYAMGVSRHTCRVSKNTVRQSPGAQYLVQAMHEHRHSLQLQNQACYRRQMQPRYGRRIGEANQGPRPLRVFIWVLTCLRRRHGIDYQETKEYSFGKLADPEPWRCGFLGCVAAFEAITAAPSNKSRGLVDHPVSWTA